MIILNANGKNPTFVDPAAIVSCRSTRPPLAFTTVRTIDDDIFRVKETSAQIAHLRAAWRSHLRHETDGSQIIALKMVRGEIVAVYAETPLEAA